MVSPSTEPMEPLRSRMKFTRTRGFGLWPLLLRFRNFFIGFLLWQHAHERAAGCGRIRHRPGERERIQHAVAGVAAAIVDIGQVLLGDSQLLSKLRGAALSLQALHQRQEFFHIGHVVRHLTYSMYAVMRTVKRAGSARRSVHL